MRAINQMGILDTGATTRCIHEGEPFISTREISNRVFQMPTGHTTRATEVKLLQHKLKHLARRVNIVPGIKPELLISMVKLVDRAHARLSMQ